MDGEDLRTLVRKRPFEPLEIGLSNGRSVLVRHPDQVVISRRKVIFGLAQVRCPQGNFSTPPNGDVVAKDWMMADLIHVVSAGRAAGCKPVDDEPPKRKHREPRPRKR